MKKLLFMLLTCSLFTSCSKEDVTPKKDYTLYSADVTIYTDNKVIKIWIDKNVARDFTNYNILHTRQTYDIYDDFSGFEIMLLDNQENQELAKLIEIENKKFE